MPFKSSSIAFLASAFVQPGGKSLSEKIRTPDETMYWKAVERGMWIGWMNGQGKGVVEQKPCKVQCQTERDDNSKVNRTSGSSYCIIELILPITFHLMKHWVM